MTRKPYSEWTLEEKEKARLLAKQRAQLVREVTFQLHKQFPEKFPHVPSTTYLGVQKGSYAHHLLQGLNSKGSMTSKDLGAGVRFGNQIFSAQIVRLLDADLIEHNNITKKYNISPRGEEVLKRLA